MFIHTPIWEGSRDAAFLCACSAARSCSREARLLSTRIRTMSPCTNPLLPGGSGASVSCGNSIYTYRTCYNSAACAQPTSNVYVRFMCARVCLTSWCRKALLLSCSEVLLCPNSFTVCTPTHSASFPLGPRNFSKIYWNSTHENTDTLDHVSNK